MGSTIAERAQSVFNQAAPFVGLDAAGKNVGVKSRRASHSQDRTAVDI